MQKVTINGKFISASTVQEIGEKKTKVRTMVIDITENPQYPNTPVLQLIGNRVGIPDQLKPNDDIRVEFVLEGRAYTKDGEAKTITNLNVINVFKTQLQGIVVGNLSLEDDQPF
ncbi:DUF3127 domain-containing protein [Flectobacillus roseus]|uniref:DUF3127 domain-containing protein n=1 Tax=Flectobacillus roseus TaxID=502259 RepID=UPI0024B69174|nr:DUF3127 domain-containing protein [Flectobacillus roseus]MDI9872248.1 DUF3127 domain-containing protein [Flectobacillus roseus]